MCGIVGYIGHRSASEILISGLRRLEYRGYDSAGVATLDNSKGIHTKGIQLSKSAGRIDQLVSCLGDQPVTGTVGIGHTRWATHGAATDENAHPHVDQQGRVAIVHNGVIENYRSLKTHLQEAGCQFRSSTDTEIILQLIVRALDEELAAGPNEKTEPESPHEPLIRAVRSALSQLKGTYGLAVMFRDYPDLLIVARLGSPLVIGVGQDEHFIASDAAPFVGQADKIIYLEDHQIAAITVDSLRIVHRDQGVVQPNVHKLEMEIDDVELGGYAHYMLKEIFEQPEAIRNAMRGRLNHDEATANFGGLNLSPQELRSIDRFVLTACGTSWHAALVGEYLIEELARIPVEVEYASELRYRNPPMDNETLVFAITQSGETADTLGALREMKRRGHPTLAICNVVGSTIAQESDGGVFLHAGPEIGVASTKAFTSQCVALSMLALYFGRMRHLSYRAGRRIISQLEKLPDQVNQALSCNDQVRRIAEKYAHCDNFLYLGRQFNFPTALEGALKLKEISYIHAEGYPAAEMKHGPIALIEKNTPAVFLTPQGFVYEKVLSNMEEVKARGGPVIAVVGQGDTQVAEMADDVIEVPGVEEFLQPVISVIPLQLLAYHIAVLRGCDVDKPRNLAKSVTVE